MMRAITEPAIAAAQPPGFALGARSRRRLAGVHPDLVAVVEAAIRITPVDFGVLEGVRSLTRQKALVAAGASRTLRSRHLTGHAVDLGAWVGGTFRWDWPLYPPIARAMKAAAEDLGVPIAWGGDWKRFRDGPHFELSWKRYPGVRERRPENK
ncbi:MAG: M15 family metallopeptidase [Inquilinaceae bacterium]